MKTFSCFCMLLPALISAQQFGSNTIGDFVGQLTNLINQNGGIGNLASALQGSSQASDNNGFGVYQRPGGPPVLTGPGGPSYAGQPPKPYPPGYPPHYRPPPPSGHPGFLSALASIARYDDLKCVPRLLCEVTSGGKPGYTGSSPSVVPATNKDTLIALLTVLNFIDESPLLVFGRAALIGYTARGNPRACITAYPTCPTDPDALVDYLNNHNGGFFKFFGGPALPGGYPGPPPYGSGYPDPNRRPYGPRPYPYNKEPDYQGSAYRPDDPYSPYNYAGAAQFYEGRIQNRPYPVLSISAYDSPVAYQPSYQQPPTDKLVFPDGSRSGKSLTFPQDDRLSYTPSTFSYSNYDNFFPDRTGTGKLLLDHKGVHYNNGPPDLVNFRDQRSIKFPSTMNFPQT